MSCNQEYSKGNYEDKKTDGNKCCEKKPCKCNQCHDWKEDYCKCYCKCLNQRPCKYDSNREEE